jgi:hypothetical protein
MLGEDGVQIQDKMGRSFCPGFVFCIVASAPLYSKVFDDCGFSPV